MPRGVSRCAHCDLSVAESLKRSDLPENERPPLALYDGPPQQISSAQSMVVGACFFAGGWFALFQNWWASLCCFVALWFLTPASADYLSERLFFNRLSAQQLQKIGALVFLLGGILGLFFRPE